MEQTTFTSLETYSGKVRCDVCGRKGYGPTLVAGQEVDRYEMYPWQLTCLRGHPHRCSCGHAFATRVGLASHMRRTKTGSHGERAA